MTIDLQIQPEAIGEVVDEAVGFRKKVAGIDEDHRDPRPDLRGEVQEHGRLGAEARGHAQLFAEMAEGPLDPLLRGGRFETAGALRDTLDSKPQRSLRGGGFSR